MLPLPPAVAGMSCKICEGVVLVLVVFDPVESITGTVDCEIVFDADDREMRIAGSSTERG